MKTRHMPRGHMDYILRPESQRNDLLAALRMALSDLEALAESEHSDSLNESIVVARGTAFLLIWWEFV